MTDWSVIFIKHSGKNTLMSNGNGSRISKSIVITTEERIKINIEYLAWLYVKSRELKKQSQGLLDTRRAIELVIRDAGGEKSLKEVFLKEQNNKIIHDLSKSNPTIAETFEQDRELGIETMNGIIANMVSS